MKYVVYTDGAGDKANDSIGCAYLIITDTTYIDSSYFNIKGMSNPTQAETIAVGLAAGWIVENLKLTKEDSVEFYIDCASTIEYCNKFAVKNQVKNFKNKIQHVKLAIELLQQLVEITEVELHKIKAHKSRVNPNSYMDRLAKLAIRRR